MIEVEGLRSLRAEMRQKVKDVASASVEAVEAVGLEIVAAAKENLDANKTNAQGTLRASGKVQKAEDGGGVDAGFFSSEQDNGYAAAVEFGRGPTMKGNDGGPTLRTSLRAWIMKKLTNPTGGKNAMDSAAVFSNKSREQIIDSVAFLIARKIHRKGTKAQPFFAPAVKKIEQKMDEIVSKYIKKEL